MDTLVLLAEVINLNHGTNRIFALAQPRSSIFSLGRVLPCLHFVPGGLLPQETRGDEAHHVLENDTHYDSVTLIFLFSI